MSDRPIPFLGGESHSIAGAASLPPGLADGIASPPAATRQPEAALARTSRVLVSLKTALRFDTGGGSVRAFGFYAEKPAPDIDPARIDEGSLLVFSVSKIVGIHPDDSIFRDAEFDAPRLVHVRRDAVLGWAGVS